MSGSPVQQQGGGTGTSLPPPPGDEWAEFTAWAKKLGYRVPDLARMILAQPLPKSKTEGSPAKALAEEDDIFSDMMKIQRQAMRASYAMKIWKRYGLLEEESEKSDKSMIEQLKELLQDVKQQDGSQNNKFTKDDIMSLAMMVMLTKMSSESSKGGLDMSFLMQLISMFEGKKEMSLREVMDMLEKFEEKKREGKEEEAKKWQEIRQMQPVETFDSFVNEKTREALKKKVSDAIEKMLSSPEESGILTSKNKIDWQKVMNQAISVVRDVIEKIPERQAPPPEAVSGEVVGPPPPAEVQQAQPIGESAQVGGEAEVVNAGGSS